MTAWMSWSDVVGLVVVCLTVVFLVTLWSTLDR